MRLSLASMLLGAAVPALALSACNSQATGSGAISALPNTSGPAARARIRPDDYSTNDLHAGGANSPAWAYTLNAQPIGTALTPDGQSNPQALPGTGSLFASAGLKGSIYYCQTSSGDGRKAFEGGSGDAAFPPTGPCAPLGATPTGYGARVDPLDFAGSDVALESTEYATYRQYREPSSGTNYGEPFEFPVIGDIIVYAYRPQDFAKTLKAKTIRFSAWTYCAISNGTISDWNDPAITADNGASVTGGKSEPITVYVRADNAAPSLDLTNHLNYTCNNTWKAPFNADPYQDASKGRSAAWTYGVNSQWPGPGSSSVPNQHFIGANQNAGVVAAIQSTPFSIGYATGSWAASANPKLSQALLQSTFNTKPKFVDPTNPTTDAASFKYVTASAIQYGGGSDGVSFTTVGDTRPECVLYIPESVLVKPPTDSYPIIGVGYLLFYGKNHGVHTLEKKNLVKFLTSAKANTIISSFENVPLNATVQKAVSNALLGGASNGGKAPCLQ